MRLTIRHRYRLPGAADLGDANGWDALRVSSSDFEVPPTSDAWRQRADERPEFAARATAISAVADRLGADVVASYGVGAAFMERHLVSKVGRLVCGDFAPESTRRVAIHMPDAEVRVHDLLVDPPLVADLHVFHRVDTEFTDRQWGTILAQFDRPVLMVMSELLTPRAVVRETITRLRGGKSVGWLRTAAAFRAMVPSRFRIEQVQIADLIGFLLVPEDRPV